jgi:hypothetical protein
MNKMSTTPFNTVFLSASWVASRNGDVDENTLRQEAIGRNKTMGYVAEVETAAPRDADGATRAKKSRGPSSENARTFIYAALRTPPSFESEPRGLLADVPEIVAAEMKQPYRRPGELGEFDHAVGGGGAASAGRGGPRKI